MRSWLVLLAALALVAGACSDDETTGDTGGDTGGDVTPDTTPDVDEDVEADAELDFGIDFGADSGFDADAPEPVFTTVHFAIDDSANQVYDAAAGLAWKGDFSYDSDTNIMTVNTGWTGPFVIVYDDGPSDDGGNEPDGETAGDGIWTVEVLVEVTDAEQTVGYGAIRGSVDGSDGNWIWGLSNAANGEFVIPAADDSAITADPLILGAFGWLDLRLTIDLESIPSDFIDWTTITTVQVKGNSWAWDLITLAETDDTTDGEIWEFILGDEVGAGNAQIYDGLLNPEQVAEFVFELNGVEYKLTDGFPGAGDTAADDGIVAETDANTAGDWVEAEIVLAANNNTSVVMGFWPQDGTVEIGFSIDDMANESYDDADGLAWKGDFAYDNATRVFTPNTGWTGPFANVWDDGPWADGGHEPTGATADDNIWGIAVFMDSPTAETTISYGAIRGSVDGSDGGWIWPPGDNGSVVIAQDETAPQTAAGLTIEAWGDIDVELSIDITTVSSDFIDWTTITTVEVKSSMWGWSEVTMVEDATTDDLYALVLGDFIGTDCDETAMPFCNNTGLLSGCDEPEFIFVLNDVEYKIGGIPPGSGSTAADDGITASTDTGTDNAWEAQDITLNGANNTIIVVPTCN